jgi:hypothetical protein
MRRLNLVSSSALMVALCTLLACGGQPQQTGEPTPDDPQSGGLESAPPTSEDPASDGQGDADDAPGNPAGAGKITICHIPPGNPANAHTITVGLPALKAHTKHGDTLGACGGDGGTGGETDAGSGDVDAGSGDVDAGPSECAPEGSTCGGGVVCCSGLTCGPEGYCEPIIG